MKMHNPPHPGETLREDVLPALGLTMTAAAEQLGVSRAALSRVLNGRAPISLDFALRLEHGLAPKMAGARISGSRNSLRTIFGTQAMLD